MASSNLISILIPNYNGTEFLPHCLKAIEDQTYKNYEVLVVDDGSTDGSVALLEKNYPEIIVTALKNNQGFARACNIGTQEARGKWLALLNNDAFPEPNWLETLVEAVEQYPEYSSFASRLVKADDLELLDGAGDAYHVSGMAWRRYHNFHVDFVPNKLEEVFSPCAAAALYLRDAFTEVGGFDEDYTSYHEDVDLGFRLRLHGYRCLYVPNAVVRHVGSASYGFQSDTQIYFGHRNLVWSYFQNMPGWLLWKYLPSHLIANFIFLIYYTLNGHPSAIWKSKIDAIRGLPKALKKRKKIQRFRRVSLKEISTTFEHGWKEPYLLGFKARKRAK